MSKGESMNHVTGMDMQDFIYAMKQYGDAAWKYAFFLTKKKEIADDIAQEAMVKAFKNIGNFRGDSSIEAWLLKIVRNTWYSYRKTAYFRKVALIGDKNCSSTGPSAEDQYFAQLITNEVWKIVLSLSRKYREVLILHGYYQLTIKEISNTLGISENTVKSRLYRAKTEAIKKLKEVDL